MSGRQAKVRRRDIKLASEAGLRVMQEQQEDAIRSAINRCNELTRDYNLLQARVHNCEGRLDALEPKPALVTQAVID